MSKHSFLSRAFAALFEARQREAQRITRRYLANRPSR